MCSTFKAHAILEDGSVITWGDEEGGGDSSAVRDELSMATCDVAVQDVVAAATASTE